LLSNSEEKQKLQILENIWSENCGKSEIFVTLNPHNPGMYNLRTYGQSNAKRETILTIGTVMRMLLLLLQHHAFKESQDAMTIT
jgi:hypothetical protein